MRPFLFAALVAVASMAPGLPANAALPAKVTAKTVKIAAPARGASVKKAVVEIVEFGDFQCPFCKRVSSTVNDLLAKYPGKVRHVWRHRPLAFHKDADFAARSAIAAGKKFWAFHDEIWKLKYGWKRDDIVTIATNLGLNLNKWVAARDSGKAAAIVLRDDRIALATGNRGTPSFMINGIPLRGAQTLDKFVAVVEGELAASKKAGKKGRGKKWLAARTKKHSPDLWKYTYGGKVPPLNPKGPVATSTPKPVDKTVWKADADSKRDGVLGPDDALVTLVVFSDLQCPFCSRMRPTLKTIRSTYGKDVRVVFRHNPLPFHKDAFRAAEASLCAKEQDAFWAMHDVLFDNMKNMQPPQMPGLAAKAGIANLAAFEECFNSRKYQNHVKADIAAAKLASATGTPASFVNGRKLVGARPFANFKALIDEELKKAKAAVKSGVRRADVYAHLQKGAQMKTPFGRKLHKLTPGNAATSGDPDRDPVVVTAFIDFQCPYCKRVFPFLAELSAKRAGKVAVVIRNLPLSFHKKAQEAAVAAECAHRQGRFWQMASRLYEDQSDLRTADSQFFETLAQDAGVADSTVFMTCMAGTGTGSALAQVKADMALARTVGATGTPTLFVNGRVWKAGGGDRLAQLDADLLAAGIGVAPRLKPAEAKAKIAKAQAACDKDPVLCAEYGDLLDTYGTAQQKGALAASAYRRGCDAGSALACVSIARRARMGRGVKKDLESARRDMERACKLSAGKMGCED